MEAAHAAQRKAALQSADIMCLDICGYVTQIPMMYQYIEPHTTYCLLISIQNSLSYWMDLAAVNLQDCCSSQNIINFFK